MDWVAVNRIIVETPEEAEKVLEAFRHRSGKVDREPGFIQLEVWREEKSHEVLILTRWRRREDFLAWTESPAFRLAHGHAKDTPGSPSGTVYEVVIPAGTAPRSAAG